MTTGGVQRGGRTREAAVREQIAEAERRQRAQAERVLDLRALLPQPEFRRWLKAWLAEADVLTVPVGLPHDTLREQLGKQWLAAAILKEVREADPVFLVELLTPTKEVSNVSR